MKYFLSGCCGGMSGLAGILGGPICEMFTLAQANEWNKAAEIEKRLVLPDFLVCSCFKSSYSVLQNRFLILPTFSYFQLLKEYGPPALKAAMDMLGYYGGSCRKPLLPLDSAVLSNIRQVLQTYGHL